jgi:exo-beta-1,3-glucanase (GH17 family)
MPAVHTFRHLCNFDCNDLEMISQHKANEMKADSSQSAAARTTNTKCVDISEVQDTGSCSNTDALASSLGTMLSHLS